jgi:chromosome segregation ATPase
MSGAPASARGGASGAKAAKIIEEFMVENSALEKEKFLLLRNVAQDNKLIAILDERIVAVKSEVMSRKVRLGDYNAQFFQDDEGARANKQRLGAVAAVIETKKIISRELERLSAEEANTATKLDTAKDANAQVTALVNGLRTDARTFRSLTSRLTDELAAVKSRVAGIKHARDEAYLERDRAQEEMREVAKQFELGEPFVRIHPSCVALSLTLMILFSNLPLPRQA